jgi:hypothetical protein
MATNAAPAPSEDEAYAVRGKLAGGARGYMSDAGFSPTLKGAELFRSRSDAEWKARGWRQKPHPADLDPDSLETVRVTVDESSAQPLPRP